MRVWRSGPEVLGRDSPPWHHDAGLLRLAGEPPGHGIGRRQRTIPMAHHTAGRPPVPHRGGLGDRRHKDGNAAPCVWCAMESLRWRRRCRWSHVSSPASEGGPHRGAGRQPRRRGLSGPLRATRMRRPDKCHSTIARGPAFERIEDVADLWPRHARAPRCHRALTTVSDPRPAMVWALISSRLVKVEAAEPGTLRSLGLRGKPGETPSGDGNF